ncbi:hypothetical protein NXV73_00290 [Bacteroides salyersiae]|nr:hypothetical protein [Bacteroides salyersiae]
MIFNILMALATFYLPTGCWCWYEMKHAPTDKELWGEEAGMTRDLLSNDRRVCPGGHLSVYKELQRFLGYFLCPLRLTERK